MVRDYSEELKASLKAMAAEVEPDGFFATIGDIFVDIGMGIKSLFGGYDIEKYVDDMDSYYKALIDKDDITTGRIDEIFAAVESVDSDDTGELNNATTLLDTLSGYVSQFADAIHVGDVTSFSYPNSIPDITSDPGYSDYQKAYNEAYEQSNPEIEAEMDRIFEDMQEDCPGDVENIKFLIYSAPEPYRSMIIENLEYLQVTMQEEGLVSNYEDGVIYIDWNDPECMAADPGGAYETFFHELGHFVDNMSGDGNGYFTDSYVTRSGVTLQESIDRDVEKVVTQRVDEMFPDLDDETKAAIVDRLIHGNLPGYTVSDDPAVVDAAKAVQEDFYTEFENNDNSHGASDAYDGSTNYLRNDAQKGPIPEEYCSPNTGCGVSGPYQHPSDYYYDIDYGRDENDNTTVTPGQTPTEHYGARESYATDFSDHIIGWPDHKDSYEQYLPGTTPRFDEATDAMYDAMQEED